MSFYCIPFSKYEKSRKMPINNGTKNLGANDGVTACFTVFVFLKLFAIIYSESSVIIITKFTFKTLDT